MCVNDTALGRKYSKTIKKSLLSRHPVHLLVSPEPEQRSRTLMTSEFYVCCKLLALALLVAQDLSLRWCTIEAGVIELFWKLFPATLFSCYGHSQLAVCLPFFFNSCFRIKRFFLLAGKVVYSATSPYAKLLNTYYEVSQLPQVGGNNKLDFLTSSHPVSLKPFFLPPKLQLQSRGLLTH